MDLFLLWKSLLKRIQAEDPQYYKKFLKTLFPVSFLDDILILTSTDTYLLSGWFENVYQKKMERFVSEEVGHPCTVFLKNNETAEPEVESEPPLMVEKIPVPDMAPPLPTTHSPLPDFMQEEPSFDNPNLPNIETYLSKQGRLPPLPEEPPSVNPIQIGCNPNYTFENFVYSNQGGNQLAYHAAFAVAEDCNKNIVTNSYNPLFIYGHSGLGKTHLLHAICNYVHEHAPGKSFLFIRSETFVNEFIESLRLRKMDAFREKYRNLDYFLLDDVQFLGSKDGTKRELFNTLNSLFSNQKHVIMTSDCPPKDIKEMEERLTSRMEQGLNVLINPPGFEVCYEILQKKAERDQITIPEDVLNYLANHIKTNIRELKGAYNDIIFYHRTKKEPISLSMAKEATKNKISSTETITVDSIIDLVCSHYHVKKEDILSKGRPKKIVIPRQIAMYLCRQELQLSFPALKDAFRRKDHSTIIYACERVVKDMEKNPEMAKTVQLLHKELRGEITL